MKKKFVFFLSYLLIAIIPLTTYSYIDVVIPCHSKDCETLELCIEGIKKYGHDIRRIIIVSDIKLSDNAEWFPEDDYPFSLKDIKRRFQKIDPDYKNDIKKGDRGGWYLQQLLKLYALFVIPDISDNILILDADTVFLRPVRFIDEDGTALYSVGDEYNRPYFEHAQKLLPGLKKVFPQYSGITHHMLFQRKVLENLFSEIENIHQKPFWKVFCDLVQPKYIAGSAASEYEIYFNYIFSHDYKVAIRKFRMQNLDSINKIKRFQELGYDYVSCHTFMRV